jgi:hypothetical protein
MRSQNSSASRLLWSRIQTLGRHHRHVVAYRVGPWPPCVDLTSVWTPAVGQHEPHEHHATPHSSLCPPIPLAEHAEVESEALSAAESSAFALHATSEPQRPTAPPHLCLRSLHTVHPLAEPEMQGRARISRLSLAGSELCHGGSRHRARSRAPLLPFSPPL